MGRNDLAVISIRKSHNVIAFYKIPLLTIAGIQSGENRITLLPGCSVCPCIGPMLNLHINHSCEWFRRATQTIDLLGRILLSPKTNLDFPSCIALQNHGRGRILVITADQRTDRRVATFAASYSFSCKLTCLWATRGTSATCL